MTTLEDAFAPDTDILAPEFVKEGTSVGGGVDTLHGCPACGAGTVSRRPVVEHPVCGYLALEESPAEPDCPKCGERPAAASGSPLVTVGVVFRCDVCDATYDVDPKRTAPSSRCR
ncbi:hypothetical protein [Halomarina ordinaria]|uniref:Thaumarchaeal output domain-containing protein n=1 Tax=Halomarina ordinaria TaxID=3033939 RepID=A0ABD5U3N3_9EURY|nr:hypothetical protein [Halomarina sp. PSRA2]